MTTLSLSNLSSVPQFNGKAHSRLQALAKPIGAVCNISCTYCYYLRNSSYLNTKGSQYVMDEALLELYIKQYIEGQNTPEIIFSWHGGEPTLLGIEYFRSSHLEKILPQPQQDQQRPSNQWHLVE